MNRTAALLLLGLSPALVACSSAPPTPDAEIVRTRDEFLDQSARTGRFRFGRPAGITPTPDARSVLFLRSASGRSAAQDLYEFDVGARAERVLLTAAQLLGSGEETISPEEQARRERARMASRGISSFSLSKDGSQVLVPLSGRLFLFDRTARTTREIGSPDAGPRLDARLSPDGGKIGFVRAGDLWIFDLASSREWRLTQASGDTTFGEAEFVAQEEMGRTGGYWFSPDGQRVCYQGTDQAKVELLHIADPRKPERPGQSWKYPRAGTANADVWLEIRPVVQIPGTAGPPVRVEWDRAAFPYLVRVNWPEHGAFTITVQNRGQTRLVVLGVDPDSGATRPLHEETDAAWVNIDQAVPRWLPDGSAFLWTSERSGWKRLELRGPDGALVRHVTPEGLGLRALAGVSGDGRYAIVSAGDDPLESRLYRVPIAGDGAPEPLGEGGGSHGVSLNESSTLGVFTRSDLAGDSGWSVRAPGGPELGRLSSVGEEPVIQPKPELVTVRHDGHEFRAAVVRPRDFVRGRRYPVIVDVYGGPGSQVVTGTRGAYLRDQWLADHGFIVVSGDARGTPNRGRDWERAIKHDVITLPMEDQAAIVGELGRHFPEMDTSRVGITGWSFGGYFSAMAVLMKPEVFHAAVAGAPVTDWHDYDTHYTEQYMGLPQENTDGYARTSAMTWAGGLRRPLLLVHGTADDNVYFVHSLKLAEALFRAGRDFEFLPLPGFTHMVNEPEASIELSRATVRFFRRTLGQAR
ncbi:MAG: S9 family peptidase [Phycisphaerae bacterium]|nr:S9 family peptidase [Phycisphaerae bacterium]